MVFIIDALDECDMNSNVQLVLRLVVGESTLKDMGLRVFVTSRPETPLRTGFRSTVGVLHQELVLHDIDRKMVDRDIEIFVRRKLEKIRKSSATVLPLDWPGVPGSPRL